MIEVSVCDIEPEKLQKNMKNNYHQYSDHPENTSDILVFFSFCMYMYMCVHTHTHTYMPTKENQHFNINHVYFLLTIV